MSTKNGITLSITNEEADLICRALRHEAQTVERVGNRHRVDAAKDEGRHLTELHDLIVSIRNDKDTA